VTRTAAPPNRQECFSPARFRRTRARGTSALGSFSMRRT
jgi:hypothetical protein